MLEVLIICIIFAAFCIGLWIGSFRSPKYKGGSLIINTKDPEKDVIRIELDMPVGEMMSKKKLIFVVKNEHSQK